MEPARGNYRCGRVPVTVPTIQRGWKTERNIGRTPPVARNVSSYTGGFPALRPGGERSWAT